MFDNIGSKIKGLAKALVYIEAIAMIIVGIILISIEDEFIIIGLPMILVGPVIAWVSSWLLYGFGELIDKTTEIARNTSGGAQFDVQSQSENERIAKLQRLLSQGLITEEEYQQALCRK